MDDSEAKPGGWSAVVYGRTYHVDRWWRAHPDGLGENSPVGRAVRATVAGGKRLEPAPRFVLSRGAHGLLVGAACRLSLVADDMNQDEHGRPLYGFVGWHTPDRYEAVPSLDALRRGFAAWAGPVYREWTGLTWLARSTRAADTRTSRPRPAPWAPSPSAVPAASGEAGGEDGGPDSTVPQTPAASPAGTASAWLPTESYTVHLLPGAAAGQLWAAALERPLERVVLVTGWSEARDANLASLTHLCSDDITHYRRERQPVPPPSTSPTATAEHSGSRQDPGRHQRPHRSLRRKQRPDTGPSAAPERQNAPDAPASGRSSFFAPFNDVVQNVVDEFRKGFGAGEPPQRPPARGGLRRQSAYDDPAGAGRVEQPYERPDGSSVEPGHWSPDPPASGGSGSRERERPPRGYEDTGPRLPAGPAAGRGQDAPEPPRGAPSPPAPPMFGRAREVEAETASYDGYFGGFDDDPPPPRETATPAAAQGPVPQREYAADPPSVPESTDDVSEDGTRPDSGPTPSAGDSG